MNAQSSEPGERCPHCGYAVGPYEKVCGQCGKRLDGQAQLAPAVRSAATAISAGAVLLLVLGFAGLAFGTLFLSNATSGVGIICGACFLAVVARIVQAGAHHREAMAKGDRGA